MQQRFTQPRRTVRIHTTAGRFAFLTHNMSAAHRTSRGHAELAAMRAFFDHPHNLRYDIAAALYQNCVADLYVETRDLILVMERGAGNRYATDADRSEVSYWGQRAR